MLLQLLSYKLTDPDSVLSDKTTVPFDGAMGDKVKLELTYESNKSLDGIKLYWNPALFTVDSYPYDPQKPDGYYLIEITPNTVISTLTTPPDSGLQGYQNLICQYQLLSGRKKLEIHLTHYNTFDLDTFLRNGTLADGVNRLVSKLNGESSVDDVGSVYDKQKNYGLYLYSEYQEPIYKFTYNSTTDLDITLISGITDLDLIIGAGVASDYSIYLNDSLVAAHTSCSIITNSTVGIKVNGTGFTTGTNYYSSFRIVSVTDSVDFYLNFNSTEDIEEEIAAKTDNLSVQLTHYNEGTMITPLWSVQRSTTDVTQFSTNDNTDIIFRATHTGGTVASAIAYLIKITNFNTSIDYDLAYNITDLTAGAIIAEASNVYRSDFTVNSSFVSDGEDYRMICLFYDTGNELVESFISSVYSASDNPEIDTDSTFRVPTITNVVDHYTLTFSGESFSNVAIYDRYKAQISIDKTTLGVDFDTNIVGITANIDTITAVATKATSGYTLSDTNLFEIITDDASTLLIGFNFRVLESWKLTTQNLNWTLSFLSEPTTINYTQKFLVSEYENEKGTPEIEYVRIQDPDTHAILTSFNGYTKDNFEVESKLKAGSTSTLHIAIINNQGNIKEHETFASSYLDQLTQTDMSSVDNSYTALIGRYQVDRSSVDADDRVAVIAKDNVLITSWWSAYECETEPIIKTLPDPTPPAVVLPQFCKQIFRSIGSNGIYDRKFTITTQSVFAIIFNPHDLPDKCELFVNGTISATTGAIDNNDGSVDGFDPQTGLGDLGGDISSLAFDSSNERELIESSIATSATWFIGGYTGNTRMTEFKADTGITKVFREEQIGGNEQFVWVKNLQPNDVVIMRTSGQAGTQWSYKVACFD